MVTSGQMEKYLDLKEHTEKVQDWVDSVYENIRETLGVLQNTDLDLELRDNPKKLAKLPRELGIYDIRTITLRDEGGIESTPTHSRWGLVVFDPIPVPKGLQPSEGCYYLEEGILNLFKEDAVAVIGDDIHHKKVKKEVKKISSGKNFQREHLNRIFIMSTEDGFDLLCISTFRFDQSESLFELVKGTENSDYSDHLGFWYDDILVRTDDEV
jgi:hypothetical protein